MGRKVNIHKKVSNFLEAFDEIKQLANEKRNASAEAERELSSMYHKIEGIEITHISQSHNLIKELKVVLAKRRDLKVEDSMLRSVVDQLSGSMGNVNKKHKAILLKHSEIVEEIKTRAKE